MTACAARSLGGGMQGRLAPQKEKEAKAVEEAGLDTERIYEVDDLVRGPAVFIATGVTTGPLLRGPWEVDGATLTESLVISAGSVRRLVETTFEQETAGAARP
jgi:fructose-1,6-bisphosphatase II